ncbi:MULTISPECIES: sensor histidine kinase [Acidovorax]|uniref:histidine kinase n=1 Tax=Acidovorax facilis TaxID=12917 RepID=A0ABV8D773_9BURK|nr:MULTISPECIES: ATP-binding protein [Acidovorax]KQB60760.1 histidine kinase [Acidovorax sp. SD340]MBO1008222.1 PAS domain-containing protein [Acidovorax sp. SD340]MCO4242364.1 ATP-binding protein [Acidovorax facilis]
MSKVRTPSPLNPIPMEGVDESTWLDVIQKMDEVYTQLIDDEVELEKKNTQLEQSQQFIFSVLSAMSDVLLVCDEYGNIEETNAALCELVGRGDASLRGTPLAALLADVDSAQHARDVLGNTRAVRSGEVVELNLIDRQGQGVPVDFNCTPRVASSGRRLGTVLVGRPMAEIKRSYQELRTAHEALKRAQQQLLHSEKMASLGRLVAGVAHELNNPISFVLGNVHALHRYSERLRQYLAAVHSDQSLQNLQALRVQLRIDHLVADLPSLIEGTLEGAQRTADIVHGLKRFSAKDREERQLVDLNEMIARAILWVRKGAAPTFEVFWEAGPPCWVMGSGAQLHQVLMNLLQNACDAAAARGATPMVWIRATHDAHQVLVTIRDNGIGIPEENLLRIFEPFFTTKPVGSGTGLGLSISYGIVEQHGGELAVHNHPEGGTEFTLTLPLAFDPGFTPAPSLPS